MQSFSQDINYKKFFYFENHVLLNHKLTLLRNQNTSSRDFRKILEEITLILASEALKDIPYTLKQVVTPMDINYQGIRIIPITVLPILRAGIGMLAPLQQLLPDSKIGFIGVQRDENTLKPHNYYINIPQVSENEVAVILDPMLATGNTVVYAIEQLLKRHITKIKIVSILATPVALDNIFTHYEDCEIYTAGFDQKLNDKGYIIPGLGDAGDRIFNT